MDRRVRVVEVPPGARPRDVALEVARREGVQLVEGWDAAVTALAAEAAAGPDRPPGPSVGADAAMELRRRAHAAQRTSVLVTTVATAVVALRRSLVRLPPVEADPDTIRRHAEEVSRARRRAEDAAALAGELDVDRDALAAAEAADQALARMDRRHAMVGQAARGLAIAAVGLALMAVGSRSASAAAAVGIIVIAVAGGGWWWISSRRRVAAVERRTRQAMAEVGATSWEELDDLVARRTEWEARFEEALEAQRQVRAALATWEQAVGDLDPDEVDAVAELARERAAARHALAVLEESATVAAASHRQVEAEWHDVLGEVGKAAAPPWSVDDVLASLPHMGLAITAPDASGPGATRVQELLSGWEGRPVWVVTRGAAHWGQQVPSGVS